VLNKREYIKKEQIIIVGAGLAGLGCARRLAEAGKKFIVISENIGGRVETSPDGEVNYGAYYITKDCTNIWPYTRKVRQMRLRDYHFHRGRRHYHLISPTVIRYLPELVPLLKDVKKFRRHFNKMRASSLTRSRRELIEADPLLRKYYHQRVGEYVAQKNIQSLTREYLEPALWASFFEDVKKMPTFIFMQTLLPLILPTYSFKLWTDKLVKGFGERMVTDSVMRVRCGRVGFELLTKKGRFYHCRQLVLATPMTTTNRLIKPQRIKATTPVSFLHINGTPQKRFDYPGYQFFPPKERAAISKEVDGTYLYFYRGPNRVKKYFKDWEIITKKSWRPALMLRGDQYIEENPQSDLFLANDHNVASTEDAFINGIYVAKLVLANLANGDKKE